MFYNHITRIRSASASDRNIPAYGSFNICKWVYHAQNFNMVEYLDGLVWTAADEQHDDKADDPEDCLERELNYAKADVE